MGEKLEASSEQTAAAAAAAFIGSLIKHLLMRRCNWCLHHSRWKIFPYCMFESCEQNMRLAQFVKEESLM